MQVINKAIRVVSMNEGDVRDRTTKEIFTQFNKQLFDIVQQDGYSTFIDNLGTKRDRLAQENREKQDKHQRK